MSLFFWCLASLKSQVLGSAFYLINPQQQIKIELSFKKFQFAGFWKVGTKREIYQAECNFLSHV